MIPAKPSKVATIRPDQVAWLRRPELDGNWGRKYRLEVWERPDGWLYCWDPSRGPLRFEVLKRS